MGRYLKLENQGHYLESRVDVMKNGFGMCVVVYEANLTFSTVFTHHALFVIEQKWRVHLY